MSENTECDFKLEFIKLKKARSIHKSAKVRVTKMNHIVEITSVAKESNSLLKIKKLDKYRYLNKDTGEILNYNLSDNRGQNLSGLKATFKSLRHLINNNFAGASNELFITLSYAENMTDREKLYKDFDIFMKRFRRKYPEIDYLSVVEPQARGAWHCHVLIRFNNFEKAFISNNDIIYPMWNHGFTKTKSLKDVDNIGAYLSAYLSDVEVCPENMKIIHSAMASDLSRGQLELVEHDVTLENGTKVKKDFLKGARLHLYPVGMNLYRCSRGIRKPDTLQMRYSDAKEIVNSKPADYSRTIDINRDGLFINSITYEQYNLKR